ncbi:LysR family transcriptional regulator [Shewanella atlantica]|uniref:LysR family transcriptional regulator n=1 Tax=Shewanella atlantica TaxID=271099 RepID=A0A431W703_9GAMM|nr:LysR family transcriptional regulator [Shewanella atlantica]RTR31200.1 LysR family transcriptional regulator [Shewanella atlantica]
MLKNTKIHYFYYAAKYSSFSKAAEFMQVSQPGVSSKIIALEKEIGIKLFERDKHGVHLTKKGAVLYAEVEKAIKSFENIEQGIRRIKGKALIKIATQPRLYEKYLEPKLTKEFLSEFFMQISTGELTTIKNWMDSGEVDVVITEGIFNDHPVFEHAVELDNLQFYWAKKTNTEFTSPIPTFVHSDIWNHWHDLSQCMPEGADYKQIMIIDTPDFSSKLIERGIGIGLLPEQMILKNENLEKCEGPTSGTVDGPIAVYINREKSAELDECDIVNRIMS